MTNISRPRLSIEITEDQSQKLWKLIPWGLKNQIFCVIVDDVIEMLEKHGEKFLAAVLSKKLSLKDYSSIDVK